jgi:hypothetical protein
MSGIQQKATVVCFQVVKQNLGIHKYKDDGKMETR